MVDTAGSMHGVDESSLAGTSSSCVPTVYGPVYAGNEGIKNDMLFLLLDDCGCRERLGLRRDEEYLCKIAMLMYK